MANRTDIPATDPGALVKVDRDDLAGARQTDIIVAVEVQVETYRLVELAAIGVGQVLCRDQMFVGGQAHVTDVDPAEQPVPVGVVRLALIKVVEGT